MLYARSRLGDPDYFALACGALLTSDGSSLIFTPACNQTPRVIPFTDVLEVRSNVLVGREIGAFHILTRKGLYLDLAPFNGDREAGRRDVESVHKLLGITS
ncbi:MAG: hypothetical protein NVS9B15_17040 [Acidobacteriaceae bacterium]